MKQRTFADEIKEELGKEEYDDYIELMKSYKEKRIAKPETLARLDELFKGHDNLVLGLHNFLNPQSIGNDCGSDADKSFLDGKLGLAIAFVEKMSSFDSFTHVLKKRMNLEVDLSDLYMSIASIFDKHLDIKADFNEFFLDGSSSDDEDESALIRISPSYVLLPLDVENIGTAGGDVLNNVCACRPPRMNYMKEEDHPMEYENDREDELFHADLLFNTLKSTAALIQKYIGILLKKAKMNPEDYLKPGQIRCIESLYGEYGVDMMDKLRCNPRIGLPVLIKRLNQKLDELIKCYPHLEKFEISKRRRGRGSLLLASLFRF